MRISKYAIYEFLLFHFYLVFYWLSFPRKDSWGITAILFLLIAALLALEYLRTKLFISPLFFWYAFWLGAITLGRMFLTEAYPLHQEWSVPLLRLVTANTAVFFWAFHLGERGKGDAVCLPEKKEEVIFGSSRLTDLVTVMLLLASVAFLLNVLHMRVIPQLSGDANATRGSFIATRYYRVVSLMRFSLLFVPPAVKAADSQGKKICLIALTGIYLFEEMLSGWRGFTLQAIILLATSYFLFSDIADTKKRRKNLLVALLAGLAVVAFIIAVTVTRDSTFDSFERRVRYAIENFYLYVAPNFLNFQTAMQKVQPKGYLLYTMEAFWGFFRNPWEIPQYIYADIEYNIGAYNVCTYLLEPYCDLGLSGTLLWSAVIAFLSGEAFGSCRRNPSGFSLVLLGIMNVTVFYLHNNFFLRSTSLLLWLAAGGVISLLSTKKRE